MPAPVNTTSFFFFIGICTIWRSNINEGLVKKGIAQANCRMPNFWSMLLSIPMTGPGARAFWAPRRQIPPFCQEKTTHMGPVQVNLRNYFYLSACDPAPEKLVSFSRRVVKQYYSSKICFMDNKKEMQKPDKKNDQKNVLGKKHDDPSMNKNQGPSQKAGASSTRNQRNEHNSEKGTENDPERKIGIDDDPSGTEKKVPRMNH
jgi:hypothetical protein